MPDLRPRVRRFTLPETFGIIGLSSCNRWLTIHVRRAYERAQRRSSVPGDTGEATRQRTKLDHRKTEEAALVRRVQAQDEIAFREIVERYQAKVFSIIYGILRNRNDAEDIAQQVFAKIYFSIKNFDFRSSLLTWIYKITVNECYDYLRKKRVRKLVYESDFSDEDGSGWNIRAGHRSASPGRSTRGSRSRI